jgi:hypothetical protein
MDLRFVSEGDGGRMVIGEADLTAVVERRATFTTAD